MSDRIGNNIVWRTVIAEALVWACIAFAASWIVFFLGSVIQEACGYGCDILRWLFYPVSATTKYLVSKRIISSDNWPGGLLVGYAIPWMIVGFLFGAYRAKSSRVSAMARRPGCLIMSAVVITTALVAVALLLLI